MERCGIQKSGMNVTSYITLDVRYGDLRTSVGGHIISPTASNFQYDDVLKFSCSRGWAASVRGWFVFDASNIQLHRTNELPMYFNAGNQWTQDIEIVMHYDHDVIVVCEMT